MNPEANPSTHEFTTTYNASVVVGKSVLIKEEENILISKPTIRGVVNFYSAGVVTRDLLIGSRMQTHTI
jgi:hypothetical protein